MVLKSCAGALVTFSLLAVSKERGLQTTEPTGNILLTNYSTISLLYRAVFIDSPSTANGTNESIFIVQQTVSMCAAPKN